MTCFSDDYIKYRMSNSDTGLIHSASTKTYEIILTNE